MKEKLKHCPFCGGHVKLFYEEQQNYNVYCCGCNKTTSFHIMGASSWEIAIKIWNTRFEKTEEA